MEALAYVHAARLHVLITLQIMTLLPRIPLLDRTASSFYTTLPYIGVRSWVAYARFEVRNGKLDRSQTGVAEYRMESPDYTTLGTGTSLPSDVASRLGETWRGLCPARAETIRSTACTSVTVLSSFTQICSNLVLCSPRGYP